jgi:hypothetical protein
MILQIIIILSLLVLGGIFLFGDTTTGDTITSDTTSSQICPNDTCAYVQSNEFRMPYSTELNLNSSCDEIKDYIITNLEEIYPSAFHSSDNTPITNSMKNELIFVLENRTDMITNGGASSPGIRFKFCCPTEDNCLL